MRYNAAIRSTADAPTDTGADSEIEDLTEVQHVGGPALSNRWLGVVIAIAVAVVGFGFAGRWSTGTEPSHERPAASGDLAAPTDAPAVAIALVPFMLVSPTEGTTLDDSTVRIDGVAGRPLGTVHMAIWLGDAVLGWTNVEVPAAGPVEVTIRTFAPAFDAPVVLRIAGGPSAGGPGFETSIALRIRVSTAVGVWRTTLRHDAATGILRVDGYGPLTTGQLGLRLLAVDGSVLAFGATTTSVEDGRPGSVGGRLVGLGSFTARLSVAAPIQPGALTLSVTWRDGPSGTVREIRRTVRESTKPGVLP